MSCSKRPFGNPTRERPPSAGSGRGGEDAPKFASEPARVRPLQRARGRACAPKGLRAGCGEFGWYHVGADGPCVPMGMRGLFLSRGSRKTRGRNHHAGETGRDPAQRAGAASCRRGQRAGRADPRFRARPQGRADRAAQGHGQAQPGGAARRRPAGQRPAPGDRGRARGKGSGAAGEGEAGAPGEGGAGRLHPRKAGQGGQRPPAFFDPGEDHHDLHGPGLFRGRRAGGGAGPL